MRFVGFEALLYYSYLRGINESFPTCCYICHPTLLTFGTEDVQTVYIVTVSSVISGTVNAMLRGLNELLNIFLVRLG